MSEYIRGGMNESVVDMIIEDRWDEFDSFLCRANFQYPNNLLDWIVSGMRILKKT